LAEIVPAFASITGLGFHARMEQRAEIDDTLAAWLRSRGVEAAADELLRACIPAAALATSLDLVKNDHLRERGFWDPHDGGVLPGLPWHTSFGQISGPAPSLGADTETLLADVLGLPTDEIAALRRSGALG
jgi:crotonobetainyl-CoA:carnitine CoA-transferase CaiB-like acyl-CoA transferase